jgi:hypothetical protein
VPERRLELEQHLVLADDHRGTKRAKCRRSLVVLRQVEDADRPESPQRAKQGFRVAGDLDELDAVPGLPIDGGASIGEESAGVGIVRERPVGALPRFATYA